MIERRLVKICRKIHEICELNEATQPIMLDVSEAYQSICSVIIIVSFKDKFKAKALADEIEKEFQESEDLGLLARHGEKNDDWFLLDYGDIFLNVMQQEKRDFYQLEEIWKRAKKIEF